MIEFGEQTDLFQPNLGADYAQLKEAAHSDIVLLAEHTIDLDVRQVFTRAVMREVNMSYLKNGVQPWARHEFYGILKEEVDELWDAIKDNLPMTSVIAEAIQVAAVCLKYMETGDRHRWE